LATHQSLGKRPLLALGAAEVVRCLKSPLVWCRDVHDDLAIVSEQVRRAFAAAATDPAADRSLWDDPEGYGRELGLNSRDLVELVGVIRYSRRRRRAGVKHEIVLKAAALAEMGRQWPFEGEPDADLTPFIEVTETISGFVLRTKAKGLTIDPSVGADYRSWGEALLRYASELATTQHRVNAQVADAIVASRNLLAACDRLIGED